MFHLRTWMCRGLTLASLTLAGCSTTTGPGVVCAAPLPQDLQIIEGPPPAPISPPAPTAPDSPLPINLATALRLAGVQPLVIGVAQERVQAALAAENGARVLWLPTLYLGGDYLRHDGQTQDSTTTDVVGNSRSTLMLGVGPSAVFALSDAIFAPLAARQDKRALEATLQATKNDAMLSVAEAYFNVQEARGSLAGAEDTVRRAEDLVRRTVALAKELAAPVDEVRARAELARRQQAVDSARERWRVASAELARVLRLKPSAVIQPLEAPHLRVTLIPPERTVDELIEIGLTQRPELAAQQAVVQATLARLKQEKVRPLIPSVLLRGVSTSPSGTLGAGYFGAGADSSMGNFSSRMDLDLQVLWELQNLGLGNVARIKGREAENRAALLDLFAVQDRVAGEVTQAFAQVTSARSRVAEAESALKFAVDSAKLHIEGLEQTRRIGNSIVLVIRPQEAVAAVQALADAYSEYYTAVGDYDRAQFRLFRALGYPAAGLQSSLHDDGPPFVGPPCESK